MLNIARFGVRIVNVKSMANFFKAAEQGTEAAAEGDYRRSSSPREPT